MGQKVTTFSDGSFLEYDSGKFDNWCVYLTRPGQGRTAPRDFEYFARLKTYAAKYGKQMLYSDFVDIYTMTTKTLSSKVFVRIVSLSAKYAEDNLAVAIDFSIIYMGMIAEENKQNAILGKKVKRLGVYQVVMEDYEPAVAANFSRGVKWKVLAEECRKRGF